MFSQKKAFMSIQALHLSGDNLRGSVFIFYGQAASCVSPAGELVRWAAAVDRF
jgi:hypothetical protein